LQRSGLDHLAVVCPRSSPSLGGGERRQTMFPDTMIAAEEPKLLL
jgi:hypothetical protein